MPDHRYHPAVDGWVVLCREGLMLSVDPATNDERIAALWPLVRDGADSAVLLDEMTRGGISAAPGFALFEQRDGAWRILARGGVVIEIVGADEPAVDGSRATAWVERDVPGVPALHGRPVGAPGGGSLRPIRVGVVTADRWEAGPETPDPAEPSGVVVPREIVRPGPAIAPPPAAAPDPVIEPPSVPERTLISQTISANDLTEVVSTEAPAAAVPPADEAGYDHLFGMTVVRKVEDAAVRDAEDEASVPLEDRTKVATGLAERRALRRAAKAAGDAEAGPAAPRHWLELSTGGREELDAPVIVGRAPSATRVAAGNIPRLVTMTTPNQDISRTHAQIALEGGTVVVTDLHSSNGTFVVVPGRPPQKLRAGEPTTVVVDTVIDLGDGATLTIRVDS